MNSSRPKLLNCDSADTALAYLCDGLFGETARRLECYELLPDAMPAACRKLLAHHDHMTTALQGYYGKPVELKVLAHSIAGDDYRREILLTLQGSGKVVEYGIVRLDLRFTPNEVRAKILAAKTPLGEILIRHNALRYIDPKWYLRFATDSPVAAHFGPGLVLTPYARLGVIYCDDHPAIELLEVVADAQV